MVCSVTQDGADSPYGPGRPSLNSSTPRFAPATCRFTQGSVVSRQTSEPNHSRGPNPPQPPCTRTQPPRVHLAAAAVLNSRRSATSVSFSPTTTPDCSICSPARCTRAHTSTASSTRFPSQAEHIGSPRPKARRPNPSFSPGHRNPHLITAMLSPGLCPGPHSRRHRAIPDPAQPPASRSPRPPPLSGLPRPSPPRLRPAPNLSRQAEHKSLVPRDLHASRLIRTPAWYAGPTPQPRAARNSRGRANTSVSLAVVTGWTSP